MGLDWMEVVVVVVPEGVTNFARNTNFYLFRMNVQEAKNGILCCPLNNGFNLLRLLICFWLNSQRQMPKLWIQIVVYNSRMDGGGRGHSRSRQMTLASRHPFSVPNTFIFIEMLPLFPSNVHMYEEWNIHMSHEARKYQIPIPGMDTLLWTISISCPSEWTAYVCSENREPCRQMGDSRVWGIIVICGCINIY